MNCPIAINDWTRAEKPRINTINFMSFLVNAKSLIAQASKIISITFKLQYEEACRLSAKRVEMRIEPKNKGTIMLFDKKSLKAFNLKIILRLMKAMIKKSLR